jgi:hypothetical protein
LIVCWCHLALQTGSTCLLTIHACLPTWRTRVNP